MSEIIAQTIAVRRYHRLEAIVSHPIAGPIISAKPNTAPFNQNTFVRSSGLLISARIACATDTFHPVIPSNTLAKNMISIGIDIIQIETSGTWLAIHKTTQLRNVPSWVIISTGFLPYISESAPIIGAAINWKRLNVASRIPRTISGCWYHFMINGNTGNSIVIERPLTKVIKNTLKYFDQNILFIITHLIE